MLLEPSTIGNTIGLVFLSMLVLYVILLIIRSLRFIRQADNLHHYEKQILQSRLDQLQDEREYKSRQHQDSWVGYRKFIVKKKVAESRDVYSFYFEAHDGRAIPSFKPGQYLTFRLHIAGQSKPVIRCYSLSDSPHDLQHYRCSIKKMLAPRDKPDAPSGLSSTHFHDAIHEGDIVDIRAPSGHFFLDIQHNTPIVLSAGGIGITPLLSMLNAVLEKEEKQVTIRKREVWFFYGIMHGGEHAFKEDLARIAKQHANVHMHFCYANPNEDDVEGRDYHHKGFISVDLFKQLLPSNNYDFFTCGPPPMMKAINQGLKEWGVDKSNIHYEAFGSASLNNTKQTDNQKRETTSDIKTSEVTFAKSEKTVTWTNEKNSILDLAEENDIDMDFGCRAGNCGSCQTAIRSGKVKYFMEPDAPIENGSCLPCVSLPDGNIVIDA